MKNGVMKKRAYVGYPVGKEGLLVGGTDGNQDIGEIPHQYTDVHPEIGLVRQVLLVSL